MKHPKLGSRLLSRLGTAEPNEPLDVLVELHPGPPPTGEEKGAPDRESFQRAAEPLVRAVRGLGGEVTGESWLSSTLRVRVPALAVRQLAALSGVRGADLPAPLHREGA